MQEWVTTRGDQSVMATGKARFRSQLETIAGLVGEANETVHATIACTYRIMLHLRPNYRQS